MIDLTTLPAYIKHSDIYRTLIKNNIKNINRVVSLNNKKFEIPIYTIKLIENMKIDDFKSLLYTIYFWKIDPDQIPIEYFIYTYNNTFAKNYMKNFNKKVKHFLTNYYCDEILISISMKNFKFINYLIDNSLKTHNEIFVEICKVGTIEYAKTWLAKYNSDIHYELEMPFRFACDYKNFKLAKWLIDISLDYSGTEIDTFVKMLFYDNEIKKF